jgi:hypothetical protein
MSFLYCFQRVYEVFGRYAFGVKEHGYAPGDLVDLCPLDAFEATKLFLDSLSELARFVQMQPAYFYMSATSRYPRPPVAAASRHLLDELHKARWQPH